VEDVTAELSEMILFEVPAYADVKTFCARLRPRWQVWQVFDNDVWLVGARAKVDDVDIAVLLREVEALVAELDLRAIRYCLDGRFYVMECAVASEVAIAL
jgi:hypothetical protein